MEPRIQYAKTSDGVSIAYFAMGQGPPLLYMSPPPLTHLLLEWEIPDVRRGYELAARFRTYVRYDCRGFGLSDRDQHDFSVEALVRDVEAVADRLGGAKLQLYAGNFAVPVAIAFAARHPERLSHLVLANGFARGSDVAESLDTIVALAEQDWELATETATRAFGSWSGEEELAGQTAALIREAATPGAYISFMRQSRKWDVSDLLQQVAAPTLVVHRRRLRYIGVEVARTLAAAIPDSQLLLLPGASASLIGDRQANTAIRDFLAVGDEQENREDARPRREPTPGTVIILFADIVESTALTERLGDSAFRTKARDLDTALRAIIRDKAGTPIEGKLLGDGVLATFTSARQAIEAALACGRAGNDGGLPLHLGLHAGDVIREDHNVYGGAVNIASRISGLSAPGEVLVSDTVRSLARTSAGVAFEDRGEQALKGVGEPVRVWAVREPE